MNMKRVRGRNHRGGSGGGGGGGGPIRHQSGNVPLNRNHVFDSIGPDLRVRGTSQQLFEKYLQLGRDATSSGDRVMAESYFQHAEHYFRILNAMNLAAAAQQGGQQQGQPMQQNQGYGRRNDTNSDSNSDAPDEQDDEPSGMSEQPGDSRERDIPISGTPPDA
ncbi:MAG: DUF4167 domain-containing protein [Pseudomonadota bacterium]|nr:DUF4167 domain-containing protein [Pseudomonadota bacterium]